MKIVLVTWRDITSQSGWHSLNALEKFVGDRTENIVYQVGYLYEDDGDDLVLVDSYFEGKELWGTIHKIPKGCVLSVQELNLPKKK